MRAIACLALVALGEHSMPHDPKSGTPWTLGPPRDDSHDGVYFVGNTTAAPPARQ
jgi:hypothetical protein